MKNQDSSERSEFEKAGSETKASLVGDLLAFVGQNKKWWLLPIVTVMLTLAALAIFAGSAAAPFIYTLF
jgi:hypothetical protein